MKALVKRLVGERGRLLIRRFGRLRWVAKARKVRDPAISSWTDKPLRAATCVAWDPEVDTYSYALGNEDELASELAALLDVPADDVRRYIAEAHDDPGIARDVGLHGAGCLVPDELRDRWTPVIGDAVEELKGGAVPEAPGFYLHDSVPDPDYQRRELEWAHVSGTPGAVVMTTHGWTEVLQDMAAASGGRSLTFRERPVGHFYCGRTIGVARTKESDPSVPG